MREIKFRAWDKQHKVMIENVTPFQSDFVLERTSWACLKSHDNKGEASFRLYGHTFDNIMQFTGLKDKNGKEIYEGDIVKQMDIDWDKTPSDTEPANYVMKETMRDVVTMDRFPCYWLKNEHFGYEGEDLVDNENCEVIGNICENPKLLKGGE